MFLKKMSILWFFFLFGHLYQSETTPVVLWKCQCEANEVKSDSVCENIDETKVTVFNITLKKVITIKTQDFAQIKVKNLTCDTNSLKKKLLPDKVILLDNGNLVDRQTGNGYNPQNFCFEPVRDNGIVVLEPKVCYPKTQFISQCCPKGSILQSESQCLPEEGFHFKPRFFDETIWENPTGTVNMIQNCSNGFQLRSRSLTERNINFLSNRSNETIMRISQSFEVLKYYDSTEFCVAAKRNGSEYSYEALYCEEDLKEVHEKVCSTGICFRKCCPEHNVFDEDIYCMKTNQNLTLPFVADLNVSHIVTGAPLCDSYNPISDEYTRTVKLLENGDLHVKRGNRRFTPKQYCVEHIQSDGTPLKERAYVCKLKDDECIWKYPVISSLAGISVFFLLLTLFIYISVKELREKMSGRCLISEVASLLVSYSGLIVIQTIQDELSAVGCQITGSVVHISTLASFFWLNVMCFDMWVTIKSNRLVDDGSKTIGKFALYSLYAWGCPLLVGIIAIVINNLPEEEERFLRPGFGERNCFFQDQEAQWLYLFSIVVVLLVINIVFFCLIFAILIKAQRTAREVFVHGRTTGGNEDESKDRCWMYVKLFFVMGISWITEVISFPFGETFYGCIAWLPTDIINMLRGIFIFLIFVCKRTTLKKIWISWGPVLEPFRKIVNFRMDSESSGLHTATTSTSSDTIDNMKQTSSVPMKNLKQESIQEPMGPNPSSME